MISHNTSQEPTGNRSGVALVIVLAMLVLMSALVIGFMNSATTETVAAKTFANGLEARQAAEVATNFVIGQIREATAKEGDSLTWISQPGAIRTIGRNKASNQVYKLYSSDKMQVSESDYKPADEVVVDRENPTKFPPGYVDINQPVFAPAAGKSTGEARYEPRYPIVNPYVMQQFTASTNPTPENPGSFSRPRGPGEGAVEGFWCDSIADPNHKDAEGKAIPLVPMPVKWIYTLKDGKITSTDSAGKIIDATKENPPVARTAFWCDDESCKLNINTASEPTYWDTPYVSTQQESGNYSGGQVITSLRNNDKSLNFAVGQPAAHEYQRYPGHPATTSLAPAIRWLFPNYLYPLPSLGASNYASQMLKENDYKERIYRLAPRIVGGTGTSEEGQKINDYIGTQRMNGTAVGDKDRLYATVDEYFFRPDRTGRDVDPYRKVAYGNPTGDPANPFFSPDKLEKLRFFLTANSRAPELNCFGRPRISIWPIHAQELKRTTFDALFAFASTLGGKAYYFVRQDPTSATVDANLTPILQTNPPRSNMDQYRYLQEMTAKTVPWAGASFLTKYGDNRDQILTEIWDYIRSTNVVDTSETPNGAGLATYTPFYWSNANAPEACQPVSGSGQVIPLRVKSTANLTTQGFGRFVTPAEVAIIFTRNGSATAPVQATLLFDMYTLGQGYAGLSETYSMRVRNADALKYINAAGVAVPMGFPHDAVNVVTLDPYSTPYGRHFMPSRSFTNQMCYVAPFVPPTAPAWSNTKKTFRAPGNANPNPFPNASRTIYPFVSDTMALPASGTFKMLHDATNEADLITIDIYAELDNAAIPASRRLTSNSVPLQTFHVRFPGPESAPTGPLTLPVPTSATSFESRVKGGTDRGSGSGRAMLIAGDTIRGVEIGGVTKGDLRLSAARGSAVTGGQDTPSSFFTKRGKLATSGPNSGGPYDTTVQSVHGLRTSHSEFFTNNIPNPIDGKLVAGANLRDVNAAGSGSERVPKLPNEVLSTGVLNGLGKPGDWDRGISKFVDGPFMGRADEGNVEFGASNPAPPYFRGGGGYEELGAGYFSPNRILPSAVNFGSLPSRVLSGAPLSPTPWETLLFRPNVQGAEHRGFQQVPDHYLLDLFSMPVVEPYAISEPFSTAGKININTEIAPFGYLKTKVNGVDYGYIDRKTALHGLFKDIKLLFVPKTASNGGHTENPIGVGDAFRYDIDRKTTIAKMQERIDDPNKGLFRTASEICEVDLYPDPSGAGGSLQGVPTNANGWSAFWDRYGLTGDNNRERPYAVILPRVTTRSNVFSVYVRAQSIRKNPSTDPDVFEEGKDQVTGEYRGSTVIERFLDPNDPALVADKYDPIAPTKPLAAYYRFRVVNTKRFTGN